MKTIRPRSIPAPLLPLALLIALLPAPAPARAEPGRFLLISDIHFDPFYDRALFGRLRDQPAENWAAILAGSQPAGFNPRWTDSNHALLKSTLDDARRRLPDPDFILSSGDLMAHDWQKKYDDLAPRSHREDPAAYQAFTTRAIRFVAGEFRRRYPATPILAALGNNDSFCGDSMVTPDGPFLAMSTDTWAPLLSPDREAEAARAAFRRGGWFTIRLPRTRRHRLVVLNSVFASIKYDNACGSSTQTPALDQLRWLRRTLEEARAAGESVWLLMHIPPGIDGYDTARAAAGGGPPVTFWQPELTAEFLRILRESGPTIQAAFFGHTHMDDFRVIRLDGRPVLAGKIGPAVSPIFGNNPGYQVFQYDRESGTLLDYQTYGLSDLPAAAGEPARPGAGGWTLEYDFREAYGFPGLDAAVVAQLAERMRTDPALLGQYARFYGVGASLGITPQALNTYRRAIANVTPSEFLRDASEAPDQARSSSAPPRAPAKSD